MHICNNAPPMLFNSFDFLVFLPVVLTLYWLLDRQRVNAQNILLLAASYFFYACWDWRFLFLLIFSTALDYYSGLKIQQAQNRRRKKMWFWLSICVNLGFLGVFKYYNFFAESLALSLASVGIHTDFWVLNVILPVGISFYTFHGLSYVIDVYKERITPEKNIVDYALFVSYFPLLVAGPIERATHLLPQLKKKRVFTSRKAIDGTNQIIWGLFKKLVIADSCATYANDIFTNYEHANSLTLLLGAVYFAFQIYGDFSGYSDIALGTSKLFGIDLLRNFNHPYFSRDIAEFWRRWHISLSTWFRDYLYIPLGGSKGGLWMKVRNTFIIFLVSGFWHGANWTFIFWGFLNALYFMPLLLTNNNRIHLETVAPGRNFPSVKELFQILTTFALTVLAWVFFRAESIGQAISYLKNMFSLKTGGGIEYLGIDRYAVELLPLLLLFIVFEWNSRTQVHPISGKFRLLKLAAIILGILTLGVYSTASNFIYFQF
jgi:D-alanyl-lipoteichoic acid acyltransferase DltB (MBOAT superfamily)